MKKLRIGLMSLLAGAALAFTMFTACTNVPSVTPHEQEAAAITTVTALRQTTDQLLVAGKISGAEAQSVSSQLDAVRALVSAARTLPAGSANIATDMTQVAALLSGLQTYLVNAGVQK